MLYALPDTVVEACYLNIFKTLLPSLSACSFLPQFLGEYYITALRSSYGIGHPSVVCNVVASVLPEGLNFSQYLCTV